jgi:hypothetical protein
MQNPGGTRRNKRFRRAGLTTEGTESMEWDRERGRNHEFDEFNEPGMTTRLEAA